MTILVDADACPVPVKEILYRAAKRRGILLVLLANQRMGVPGHPLISFVLVEEGPDEADNRILERVQAGDLVVSADIPLAALVVKQGGAVLDPRGKLLTEHNIGDVLATRNLMDGLRSEGLVSGGPAAYGLKDRQAFANQLDKYLTGI